MTDLNEVSTLRSLEGKMIMFYGWGKLMFFTGLKFEVIEEPAFFGLTTTKSVYMTGGKFYGYNEAGEFVGVYEDDQIEFTLRHYNLWELRKQYLKFEKAHTAMLDKMDELVAIKAGIHPSIIS